MKGARSWRDKKAAAVCLAGMIAALSAACGGREEKSQNLLTPDEEEVRVVDLFSPMEKTDPNSENVARNAMEQTVCLAEERLGVQVDYMTYTAEDYQDKTYDEVTIERVRNDMDDQIGRAHV